jgi:hypothetical protein
MILSLKEMRIFTKPGDRKERRNGGLSLATKISLDEKA